MKCDDSNQVSLSSKLRICWECCFLPGLVITKETLLLCTIAVTWPIEGPCLLGALSTDVSWCRCVLPARYPCSWARPKLHLERGTCSRYLLPLPWALCLSLWSILSFSSMSCPLCFFCLFVCFFPYVYLPLDFWSTPSYDLVLKGDRRTHTHSHTQGICWKRRGWCRGEWSKNEQRKDFELSCCLRPWPPSPWSHLWQWHHCLLTTPFICNFHRSLLWHLPHFTVTYIQMWVSFLDEQLAWGNFSIFNRRLVHLYILYIIIT